MLRSIASYSQGERYTVEREKALHWVSNGFAKFIKAPANRMAKAAVRK